jgi:AcrR family transcriptional regulator
MDGVAKRAGTGKAALYRRWPNIEALVLFSLTAFMENMELESAPDTGTLRGDLSSTFLALAGSLNTPAGAVFRELISEATHEHKLMAEMESTYGTKRHMELAAILEKAMLRGESPRQAIDPYVIEIAPALIFHQFITTGFAPTQAQVQHIVDRIVLPLVNLRDAESI